MIATSSYSPQTSRSASHISPTVAYANGVENRRHDVVGRACRGAQPIQRPRHLPAVAGPLQPLEPGELLLPGRLVDVEDLDRRLVFLDEIVHADDDLLLAFDRLLKTIGALGDLLCGNPRSTASTIPPIRSI